MVNGRLFVLLGLLVPGSAGAQCRLCSAGAPRVHDAAPARPLSIEIDATLDFSRVAQGRGGGSIDIDERSGARAVRGGLVDLGGLALKGSARLSGDPGRHVRVEMPPSIPLTSSEGGRALVTDLRTDLGPDPTLDASGQLSFSFGGRLSVSSGASGDFRGRIAIVADYQ